MKNWLKGLGALSLIGALGACEEGPASSLTFTTTPDVWIFVQGGANDQPLLVESHGAPFDRASDGLAADLARLSATGFTDPWLKFTALKAEAPTQNLRMVWLFDADRGWAASDICQARMPGFSQQRPVMEIDVVFCQREKLLAAAHGWMKRPNRPDDQAWTQLIRQMARQVLKGK